MNSHRKYNLNINHCKDVDNLDHHIHIDNNN